MELLQTFLAKLIHVTIEYFVVATCVDLTLEQKIFTKKKLLLILFIIIGTGCCVLIPIKSIGSALATLSGIVCFVMYIHIYYTNHQLYHSLILYFLLLILHSIIQLVLFMWLPQSLLTNWWFLIIAFIITFLASYPIIKFLPFRKLYRLLTEKNIVVTILFFNVAFVTVMHNTYYKINVTNYYANLSAIIAIIVLGIAANIYCLLNYLKRQKQQALLDAYNNWLPIVEHLIAQIRTIQHNYDNELQTFKALPLIHKDVKELKAAIMDYIRQIIDTDIPLEITLDYIPNEELRQCIMELSGTIYEHGSFCIITYNKPKG